MTVGNKTMFDKVINGNIDNQNRTASEAMALIWALFSDLTREILENEYKEAMKMYFEEENKYRNWYYGFSQEDNPLKVFDIMEQLKEKIKGEDPLKKGHLVEQGTEHKISTCATSGNISTPGFGKPFNPSIFINPVSSHTYKITIDFSDMVIPNDGKMKIFLSIDAAYFSSKEQLMVCGQNLEKSEDFVFEIMNCSFSKW